MLIEEIINEWFGYKGIVTDIIDEYKREMEKRIAVTKLNLIFWNIFSFFILLLAYQLKFLFFVNAYNFISKNYLTIFYFFVLIIIIVSVCIIKNKEINFGNKVYYYIILIAAIQIFYSLKPKSSSWQIIIILCILMIPIIVFEYKYETELRALKWWFLIILITVLCFIFSIVNWEVPIVFILFKLLYQKYEKYKNIDKSLDRINSEIKKYKIITLNYIFEDFYKNKGKVYCFILKIIIHLFLIWMCTYVYKLILNNVVIERSVNLFKIFFILFYLITAILLEKLFLIVRNWNYIIKQIVFYFTVITLYYLIIRRNTTMLLFFILTNILIFIVYFCISFIKSSQRKDVLKKNLKVRENILMSTINNFEKNSSKKYKIEILKSLSTEINRKIFFLRTIKWGFIVYILLQIISNYLYRYFDFKTLDILEELKNKIMDLYNSFTPENVFNGGMIFLMLTIGVFTVSQIIEKLLPYKLMELIYLNETINNLLLKEQKKGLNNV